MRASSNTLDTNAICIRNPFFARSRIVYSKIIHLFNNNNNKRKEYSFSSHNHQMLILFFSLFKSVLFIVTNNLVLSFESVIYLSCFLSLSLPLSGQKLFLLPLKRSISHWMAFVFDSFQIKEKFKNTKGAPVSSSIWFAPVLTGSLTVCISRYVWINLLTAIIGAHLIICRLMK